MTGIEGGESKTLLAGFVNRVKSIADEIKDRQADVTDICKEAREAGFDSTKIREVVRWLQKIDKHGREKVDEAETIFDLYRSVVDTGGKSLPEAMETERDKQLLAMFAPDDQVDANLSKRRKTMRNSMALARAAREARKA